jgi:pSer/pThr/pTyr-binding forkhead associated (FHA) protein
MGSSNGTFVNGLRIEETQLKSGDNIQIGPLTFVFESGPAPEAGNTPAQGSLKQISDEDFSRT